jgi:uracil permease
MLETKNQTIGLLPDETPSPIKLILFALQMLLCALPATVLVPMLTGFNVGVTLFGSGLATIAFLLLTKRQIPLFYGSSFSYITAVCAITGVTAYGQIATTQSISSAQSGIIASGILSIIAGLLISKFGKDKINKILPPTVTGSIAIIIGLSLAGSAMQNASSHWGVALITMVGTVLFSVFLKGTLGQLPILFGIILGYLVSIPFGLVDFAKITTASIVSIPQFTLPTWSWTAIISIAPICLATIPESSAHLFQLDLYVNDLAKKKNKKEYRIAEKVGLNLVGDGIGDCICGLIGSSSGTNYGEVTSTQAITKNFSTAVLIVASIIVIIMSFSGTLSGIIFSIPVAVVGGISIYLFGVIAVQGIAIMVNTKVDMFNNKNLAVISTMLIIGLGGTFAFNGMIPFFGIELPAIATAAVSGIVLNLILNFREQ